ncbi:MAG: hypothetical protein FJW37_00750 [Acidobacteria bacterium]|nr:hypothetical protein [Acidobacteriota bacterium]
MAEDMETSNRGSYREDGWRAPSWLWPGLAIGAGVGMYFAVGRRRKSHWRQAKDISERVYDRRYDLMEGGRNLVDRLRLIIDEGRKVVDEATDLWSQGRSLVKK